MRRTTLALRPVSHDSTKVLYRPLRGLEPGWLTTDDEPGDVLVFHCLTTHAALPNHQARLRIPAPPSHFVSLQVD